LVRRIDPYVRQQAIRYLHERFDSDVELTPLSIQLPRISSLKLLFTGGCGALARIQGESFSLRHNGRRDVAPMFAFHRFSGEVDLGTLFNTPKTVRTVSIDGMVINIPPKDEASDPKRESPEGPSIDVLVQGMIVTNSILSILPKDKSKTPLRFDLHRVKLEAKISETMSGWKRWAFKPVDPFFSKDGAGTLLRIKIEGSAKEPKFGLNLGTKASTTTQPTSDKSAKYEFSN